LQLSGKDTNIGSVHSSQFTPGQGCDCYYVFSAKRHHQ